jgi:hypothetical protein
MRSPKTDVGVYMPVLLMPREILGLNGDKGTGKVSGVPRIFFRWGGSTNSVGGRGNGDLGAEFEMIWSCGTCRGEVTW